MKAREIKEGVVQLEGGVAKKIGHLPRSSTSIALVLACRKVPSSRTTLDAFMLPLNDKEPSRLFSWVFARIDVLKGVRSQKYLGTYVPA